MHGTSANDFPSNATKFQGVIPALEFTPQPKEVSAELPQQAKRYLEQAVESVASPDGAAMLANSSVDAMLKARGLEKGSVYSRLKTAVQAGLITEEIRKWADAVRIESNNPRHADTENPHVSPERARLMIDFAWALGEILFVLPSKAKSGTSEAESLE